MGDEAIRLVIWDLDETFWTGTLSEGEAFQYSQDNHDIVVALAKRGIISSVCSKNDFDAVEAVLREHEIFDYFVMPSIDWSAKGPRLRKLIEDIQLRPETVLFIDDNPSNRAEAAACVPGLQVAGVAVIRDILNAVAFRGAEDIDLTRLRRYQLLQRRKADETAFEGSNKSFLGNSNIRVIIQPDIGAHLDRAIELINRTNQLNFTKDRVLGDASTAATNLLHVANRYCYQAGLIRVWDDYGDYGFCGIYVTFTRHGVEQLLHFCFSCRILGMGVEQWLYARLGKPTINIVGHVASQLDAAEAVDWINQHAGGALIFADGEVGEAPPALDAPVQRWLAPEIRLRGGCELDALSHYLRQDTPRIVVDTNHVDGAFLVRRDTISNLVIAQLGSSTEITAAVNVCALLPSDTGQDFFAGASADALFVLSCSGDPWLPLYRHNKLGFKVATALRAYEPGIADLTRLTPGILEPYLLRHVRHEEMREHVRRVVAEMRADYTYLGPPSQTVLRQNYRDIFSLVPANVILVVLLPNCHRGEHQRLALAHNRMVQEVAAEFPDVLLMDTTHYVDPAQPWQDGSADHLDRLVYFKLYTHLVQLIALKASTRAPLEGLLIA